MTVGFLLGAVAGYALAWFTFGDEARFWKERADYWYDNSTQWMRSWFRDVHDARTARRDTTGERHERQ